MRVTRDRLTIFSFLRMFQYTDLCIPPETPIREAVRVLNDGHCRIAMIVDEQTILLGVLADSDVRRAILKGLDFNLPVSQIMVKRPIVATPDMPDKALLFLMKRSQTYQLPIVEEDGRLVGLKLVDDLLQVPPQAEAFILAGGLGTRLFPLTEHLPKPLIQVGGQEVLFTIVDSLIAAGIVRITLAINYKKELIKEAMASRKQYIGKVFHLEESIRLGTAGALSLLEPLPKIPLIVLNADILTKVDYQSMLNFHITEENDVTVAVRQEHVKIPFGVSTIEGTRITKIDEKPDFAFFVNAGIYVFKPDLLRMVPKDTPMEMPSLLNQCIRQCKKVGSFPVHEYWIDIGRPSELQRANAEYKDNF